MGVTFSAALALTAAGLISDGVLVISAFDLVRTARGRGGSSFYRFGTGPGR